VNPARVLVVVTGMSIAKHPEVSMRLLLRLAGAGLLVATAAIHLDLYLTGYRTIPTIGWLFLLQVIAGFGLAALVLISGSRLVAAAAAGFSLSTLGGYLLSVQFGLFGFREVRTTAGIVAGIIEVAAFAALAGLAAMPAPARVAARHLPSRPLVRNRAAGGAPTLDSARADHTAGRPPASAGTSGRASLADWAGRRVPYAGPAVAGISVVALALLGGALAGAGGSSVSGGSSPAAAGAALRTENVGGSTVLANAKGLTLYWFAPDTSTKSVCYGSCAAYWPPVPGPQHAGTGVTGTLGTIRRTGGSLQETYNGHPLYTYVGDSGPGQAHGNNLNLNGGLWHEVVVSP
jgi:predicted lipoprotein with Yx(FWY)xxD motif